MKFSEKIKAERSKRNMGQPEFAKLIGVSLHSVSDYETGKAYPRTREAYKRIADSLDLKVDYLLTEDEDFIIQAGDEFGSRGRKQAEQLLEETVALYAGGELADEDMDELIIGFQQMFLDAKKKNKKYTPKKYLKNTTEEK